MVRHITTETRLRNRVRDLERRQDSWHVAVDEDEVWDYLEHLAALHHLAHNGIRRPDDLGGSISVAHAASKPPLYQVEAAVQLKAEKTHLRQRTETIRRILNQCDPEPQQAAS